MTSDEIGPIRRRVDQVIEQAAAEGAFNNLAGMGRPLPSDAGLVPGDMRVPFKVLGNAGMAPAWVGLASEIEGRIDEFRAARRAHEQRMRRARDHALAGPAGDFAARFRAAGRAHAELRDSLERDIQAIIRLIDRLNTIAPRGAAHFGFLPRAEIDAHKAAWPWSTPAEDSA